MTARQGTSLKLEEASAGRDRGREPRPSPRSAVFIAYVAHLAVPLFLLFDQLLSPHLARIQAVPGLADQYVPVAAATWLVIGVGVLGLWRDRAAFLRFVQKPLISFYTILIVLLLAELAARVGLKRLSPYPGVWMPGTKLVTEADPRETPGVKGTKRFTVNEIGLRGPSLPRHGNPYKIVTVGGSTTECDALDDSEEWPHRVMEGMNSAEKNRFVWVGNAGVSGHTTAHHLAVLESLPILSEADMLIFMIGANDLWTTLDFEGASTESFLAEHATLFAAYLRGTQQERYPLYKRLRLFEVARGAVYAAIRKFHLKSKESQLTYSKCRQKRARAPVVPLPDLNIGLKEYRRRIVKFAERCQARRVRCLFLTQPSLWRPDLPPAEQRLLWFGWVGRFDDPKGYITVADGARAINAYNEALLDVCRSNRLECFDLAARVPKDSSVFFDDFHFNENGACIVARLLVDYLRSTSPFAEAGAH